jgi:hypothetical protein
VGETDNEQGLEEGSGVPETGGKNIARIARNMSEPHILTVNRIFVKLM